MFYTDGKISVRINLPLFSIVLPSNSRFLSCRPFVVITTFSTGLVGVIVTSVSWLDNVVITTKGLQDRNIHILYETTVENKGKLILRKGNSQFSKEVVIGDKLTFIYIKTI